MSVLDLVVGELSSTKTHAARRWSFLPAADATAPSLGTLTIVQGTRDLDSYGVAVEGRQVLFAKQDDAGDVYGVTCSTAGVPVRCNCPGHGRTGNCKHKATAAALLAEGVVRLPAARVEPLAPSTADLQGGF